MLRERFPLVRGGNGAIIILAGTNAFKWFIGPRADQRCQEEYSAHSLARACSTWGPYLLPVHLTPVSNILRSKRGNLVDGNARQLCQFVEKRLSAAADPRILRPVPQLLESAKLRMAIGDSGFASLEPLIENTLSSAHLPVGPTHGDLHRGNILVFDGRHLVIDTGRYNAASAPLFDRIHFHLTERRLKRRLPWIELLAESQDIVACALDQDRIETATPPQVALAYGLNRVAYEGYESRLKGRVRAKYWRFATQLLRVYGGCDPRK